MLGVLLLLFYFFTNNYDNVENKDTKNAFDDPDYEEEALNDPIYEEGKSHKSSSYFDPKLY